MNVEFMPQVRLMIKSPRESDNLKKLWYVLGQKPRNGDKTAQGKRISNSSQPSKKKYYFTYFPFSGYVMDEDKTHKFERK